MEYIVEFIPPVTLTVINMMLPMITNLIIKFERWDYQSTVTNNQIWRNFLAKEFNFIIFFLINVNMILPNKLVDASLMPFEATTFPCPEVQISINLLK